MWVIVEFVQTTEMTNDVNQHLSSAMLVVEVKGKEWAEEQSMDWRLHIYELHKVNGAINSTVCSVRHAIHYNTQHLFCYFSLKELL